MKDTEFNRILLKFVFAILCAGFVMLFCWTDARIILIVGVVALIFDFHFVPKIIDRILKK